MTDNATHCCPSSVADQIEALVSILPRLNADLLEVRFIQKVDLRGDNECWPYLGVVDPRGSALFWRADRGYSENAQRLALELALREVLPLRSPIVSSCGSRHCCNPAHLRLKREKEPRLAPGAYRPSTSFVEETLRRLDLAVFWSRVDRSNGPAACWPWTRSPDRDGYGQAMRHQRAHRIACEFIHGPLGERWALHHCDNPTCCNPGHLYPGTAKDNARDRARRGRGGKPSQVLTDEELRHSRYAANVEGVPAEVLAARSRLSVMYMDRLLRGHARPHTGGPLPPKGRPGLKASDHTVREIRVEFAARATRTNHSALARELAAKHGLTPSWVLCLVYGEARPEAGGPVTRRNYRSSDAEVRRLRERHAHDVAAGGDPRELALEIAHREQRAFRSVWDILIGAKRKSAGGPLFREADR